LIFVVPKFHLTSHIDACADKFLFNWTKNVGWTCGEIVETNWANLNLLSTSACEMDARHRKDTLTDAKIDMNWHK
ncbi:hypothetical protein M422DRAFT_91917, partial [Sphaerobolus stellatus SS14]